jgi:methylenetetrahydrofolate dehydrogenase (NADP+)/methenyltetrahydrofolate cyclohydrolase
MAAAREKPCLATLRVGERSDDIAYEDALAGRAASVGVKLRCETLRPGAGTGAVTGAVRALADDDGVHGILVFRPLPSGVDESAVLAATPQAKDVDGVTAPQMAGLYALKSYGAAPIAEAHDGVYDDAHASGVSGGLFIPCTAEAVMHMLDYYDVPVAGKRAVVIGRSPVIGKPVAHLLLARDATVTVCHSRTPDLADLAREADILVCAAGLARAGRHCRLGADYFSPKQTVIDVAVNVDRDGIYGDVDMDAAVGPAAAVAPTPGGLGSVTTAVLMEHVVRAAEIRQRRSVFP